MTLMEIVPFHTEKSVSGQTDKAVQTVISQQKFDIMKLQEDLNFLCNIRGNGLLPDGPVFPVWDGVHEL